jgi:hypothetical protein
MLLFDICHLNRILPDHLPYHSYRNTPVLRVMYHIAHSQKLVLKSQNSPPADSLLSGAVKMLFVTLEVANSIEELDDTALLLCKNIDIVYMKLQSFVNDSLKNFGK